MPRLPPCLLLLQLLAAPVMAETCKYVDAEGHVIYANVPVKNARREKCLEVQPPPDTAAPATATQAHSAPARARVDTGTQRRRDDQRRRILEEEVAREQSALDDARRQLAEQEAVRTGDEKNYQRVLDRLKPFQEAVETHQKNLEALRRELAAMP